MVLVIIHIAYGGRGRIELLILVEGATPTGQEPHAWLPPSRCPCLRSHDAALHLLITLLSVLLLVTSKAIVDFLSAETYTIAQRKMIHRYTAKAMLVHNDTVM